MIVMERQCFKFCETECMRRNLKFSSITVTTLKNRMETLTIIVEENISQKLPEKDSIVFDGWSTCDTLHGPIILVPFT